MTQLYYRNRRYSLCPGVSPSMLAESREASMPASLTYAPITLESVTYYCQLFVYGRMTGSVEVIAFKPTRRDYA
jgi:hypothetical protein